MTNAKQEELKKLLASTDFTEKSCEHLSIQELIILKNSAKNTKEKNIQNKQLALFFTKREEFFLHTLKRRIQTAESLFVFFSQATNLPYVFCDPDSGNDRIFLFSSEVTAKNAAGKKNDPQLRIVKLETKQFLGFFISLFAMGVNELYLDQGANELAFELDSLVKQPDYSKIPEEKRPVFNPELLLTAMYFAQERAYPKEKIDLQTLHDLEEEMLADLHRGKVLLPIQVPEGSGEKVQVKDIKLPVLKLPNGNSYHPVCTDPNEFQKFNRENAFRALTVDSEKLKGALAEGISGILLNPASVRLIIPREKL